MTRHRTPTAGNKCSGLKPPARPSNRLGPWCTRTTRPRLPAPPGQHGRRRPGFPEAHHDFIRIGLGLYGLDASGSVDGLQPIGTFRSAVSHLHSEVPAGEPVGYGAHAAADHGPDLIATIPVGYADGLPRAAGMGLPILFVEGTLRPIVGPVCMDSCMVDATGLDFGGAQRSRSSRTTLQSTPSPRPPTPSPTNCSAAFPSCPARQRRT